MSKKQSQTTLIERFGFKDRELTTPQHDSLFCWLFKKENIISMLKELKLSESCSASKIHWEHLNGEGCDWNWQDWVCSGNCSRKNYVSSLRLNYESLGGSSPDQLAVAVSENAKKYWLNETKIGDCINIEGEYAVLSGKYNIGFIDAKITLTPEIIPDNQKKIVCYFSHIYFGNPKEVTEYYVEIKPKIQSIGELIRQINLYRSHIEGGIFIVLTDYITSEFIPILRSQDIFVYIRPSSFK